MPSVPIKYEEAVKKKRDIADFLENNDIEAALNVLRQGLKAEKTNRSRDPKTGHRGIQYSKVPDHTIRFHSAKLLLEYGFGKPATRAEIEVKDTTNKSASPQEILQKIQNSAHSFREITNAYISDLPNAEVSDE
tara:strand:+ start:144 stop:545 length:402 start_codon:yes stop_codon:yes gene_type:complete